MSDWETLLNKVKIGSSPNTYLTVKYRHQRIGADMLYDVYVKGELQSSSSYRNDSQGLDIRLDDGTTTSGTYTDRYYNATWKASGSGHWPVSGTFSFRLHNKTTGKLKLYIRFWDSQGAASIDYSKTWNDLYVAPAGPILQKGSVSQYINHLKVNVSNTITGNMIKYELAKVSDGTVVKIENLSSVISFTVDITGLNPGVSYNGVYKIRAYANDCWGNWLTLSDTNLKTKNLPSASLGSTNPILETNTQSININSNDDISSFQYELKTTDNTSIRSESSLTGTSRSISLSSSNINTILQKYPNSQNAGCRIITKVISNGVTYTLNELSFNYLIPNTYKPTFDSSKIIEVSNIAYTDIMGTNTSKYIKGHNRLQGKIVPMVPNGYANGKDYLISCGNKQISLNYSESNQTFTLDNIDNNTLSVTATDSRGFTNSGSKSLILVDYSNPICNDINIIRQGGVGTVAVLNAKGKYTNWSGLALNNQIISVKYKYKVSDGNYSNLIDITNKLTTNADGTWEIRDAVLDTTFEASNKYDIVLVFNDRLETITLSPYRLSTADVLLWRDLANKRLGVNKKPDYTLDVDGVVNATSYLRSGIEVGVDPTDTFRNTIFGDNDSGPRIKTAKIYADASGFSQDGAVLAFACGDTHGYINPGWGSGQECWIGGGNAGKINWKKRIVFKEDLVNLLYPVGSVYLSMNDTNPSILFGGTWERINDAYLWATSSSNGGWKGGSLETGSTVLTVNQIPSHGHSISSSGAHSHSSQGRKNSGSDGGAVFESFGGASSYRTVRVPRNGDDGAHTHTANNTGGGQGHTHTINPTYVNVIMWKRTA